MIFENKDELRKLKIFEESLQLMNTFVISDPVQLTFQRTLHSDPFLIDISDPILKKENLKDMNINLIWIVLARVNKKHFFTFLPFTAIPLICSLSPIYHFYHHNQYVLSKV